METSPCKDYKDKDKD